MTFSFLDLNKIFDTCLPHPIYMEQSKDTVHSYCINKDTSLRNLYSVRALCINCNNLDKPTGKKHFHIMTKKAKILEIYA